MAYNDRRRDTWAAIFEKESRPYVWLWLNPETGKPEVTRRTTGLRKYFPVSQRQETITFSDWVKRTYHDNADPTNYSGAWSGSRPTGLYITRVRDSSGEEFDLPAMGNGTTVWIEDPNPGKNEAVREPLPEAVSVPEEPEPQTPVVERHPLLSDLLTEKLVGDLDVIDLARIQAEQGWRELVRVVQTPLQARVAELQDELTQLKCTDLYQEVARLKERYETPCPGLVRHYGSSPEDWRMVACGGFLGHPGECAEVW